MQEISLKIEKWDLAKIKFKDMFSFIFDSFFLLLIYSYIQYIGVDNIEPIQMISLLATMSFRTFFYQKIYKQEENYKNYFYPLIPIGLFCIYVISLIIEEDLDDAVNYIFTLLIPYFIFVCFKVYKVKEKKKVFNDSINLLFIMSFSCVIISNGFFDLKNFLFGVTSYTSIIHKVKDINIYITLILVFLISHPLKDGFLLDFGKNLNVIVSLLVLSLTTIHIYNNTITNTIDYELLAYYIAILLTTLIIINLVTEQTGDIKTIVFKISFILYVINVKLRFCPDVFFAFLIFGLMTFFVLKRKMVNNIMIILMIIMISLSCIITEIRFYIEDVKSPNNYGGLLLAIICIIGLCVNTKKEEFKIVFEAFENIYKLIFQKKIHKSTRIKYEKVRKRIFYINIKWVSIMFVVSLGFVLLLKIALFFVLTILEKIFSTIDFLNYVIHINIISKNILLLLGNIWFELFLFLMLFIVLVISSGFVYITNARIVRLSITDLKYIEYKYEDLKIQFINNKKYIYYKKVKFFEVKDKMEIYDYLMDKIGNSTKEQKSDIDIMSV